MFFFKLVIYYIRKKITELQRSLKLYRQQIKTIQNNNIINKNTILKLFLNKMTCNILKQLIYKKNYNMINFIQGKYQRKKKKNIFRSVSLKDYERKRAFREGSLRMSWRKTAEISEASNRKSSITSKCSVITNSSWISNSVSSLINTRISPPIYLIENNFPSFRRKWSRKFAINQSFQASPGIEQKFKKTCLTTSDTNTSNLMDKCDTLKSDVVLSPLSIRKLEKSSNHFKLKNFTSEMSLYVDDSNKTTEF